MIDIEATGIDPAREELLSVGILEVEWNGNFWVAGRGREWIVRYEGEPQSEFAKEHMVELFRKCNDAPLLTTERLRWEVLEFLRSCGPKGCDDTYFMGWNCSNFDLPFLIAKGVLQAGRYETIDGKDKMVGDFHYRIYEMGGAVSLTQNVKSYKDRGKLLADARDMDVEPKAFPPGKQHDALYDCYTQLKTLNGLIKIARGW